MFKQSPAISTSFKILRNLKNCKNSQQWEFIVNDPELPGHACGLPSIGSLPGYLWNVGRHLKKVRCSDPKPCFTADCDPYMSVFTQKSGCHADIRKPNLDNWKTDKVFVSHFIYVGNTSLDNVVNRVFSGNKPYDN